METTQATSQNPSTHRCTRCILWTALLLILGNIWLNDHLSPPVATAQIPDSGAQRKLLIDEVRKTNQLLQQLNDTIRNGTIKVEVTGADNTSATKHGAKGTRPPDRRR